MKKYLLITFALIISLTCLTGCLKRDLMDDINIITTIYPIEYVTNRLYGENNNIESIYPKSSIPDKYKMSKKQLNDYSEYDLFIYNGESNEREYATSMLNKNKNLKIIDASYGLSATYAPSDIWLNPSNILMLGQNIRNELKDFIANETLKDEIDKNYDLLKVDITELETELKKTADNSVDSTIVVSDESLNFLTKYGFNVINLTNDGKDKFTKIEKAKQLINNGDISYIFVTEHTEDYSIVDTLKDDYKVEILNFRSLDTITDDDYDNNDDYISIMHYNIDLLKKETYK